MPRSENPPPARDGWIPAVCVIPAAGLSSRMGRFKPTLSYRGEPLIVAVIRAALSACATVIVVTGHNATELTASLTRAPSLRTVAPERIHIVHNPLYLTGGMVSSIAYGARAAQSEWIFVAPADMPELRAEFFHTLWRARTPTAELTPTTTPTPVAFFPRRGERTGHPVLLSRAIAAEAPTAASDPSATPDAPAAPVTQSMRAYLAAFPHRYVPIDDPAILTDIDTAADYAALS